MPFRESISAKEARLREAIARQRTALRELDEQRGASAQALRDLEVELAEIEATQLQGGSEEDRHSIAEPSTPAGKVALFRSLFRGREDVYPTLWANTKTGRTGYAPACANEWVRGVCEKPRVRCGPRAD